VFFRGFSGKRSVLLWCFDGENVVNVWWNAGDLMVTFWRQKTRHFSEKYFGPEVIFPKMGIG